ncbi:recombination regulator RecX [Kurthia sibirica]|uniref:Regulatory protein RecX n=1 Tax=Kurthia sibirica TaxID=202750 RepID=A0A2U3ALA4_9BACL|nr:recombination regulator RecX [Kurthia sibirica]PWI25299.1 recombination regulator RecX [Kurthia sibirica]GEK34638.1 regulatory protein RecX [Kurthia sibirica]
MTRVITKITRQKRNEERYNIFLDEKYAFSVDESILIQHGLTKGKVLDELAVGEIAFEDEVSRAFNRGLSFLSYQMRSEHEIHQKLLADELGEAVIMEAIQKLKRIGLLNDETYSKALTDTKKRTSKKGPRAIAQDLKQKGISPELQQQMLDEFSDEEQLTMALALAQKKADAESRKTPSQVKQKIQEMLMRKGYGFAIIQEVIGKIELIRDEEDWANLIEAQGEKIWRKYSQKYEGYDLKMRVKQGLYQKGFPSDIIEQFIDMKEHN